jgi:hypothetical protein
MKNVSKSVSKKRGRPATGQDPVTAIRLSPEIRKSVDNWALSQPGKLKRSEAIRQLLQIGLVKSTPSQLLRHFRAMEIARQDPIAYRDLAPTNRPERTEPDLIGAVRIRSPDKDAPVDRARPKR